MLGSKKSLLSPRLELMVQCMAQCNNVQSQLWYHSAIQAPQLRRSLVHLEEQLGLTHYSNMERCHAGYIKINASSMVILRTFRGTTGLTQQSKHILDVVMQATSTLMLYYKHKSLQFGLILLYISIYHRPPWRKKLSVRMKINQRWWWRVHGVDPILIKRAKS